MIRLLGWLGKRKVEMLKCNKTDSVAYNLAIEQLVAFLERTTFSDVVVSRPHYPADMWMLDWHSC